MAVGDLRGRLTFEWPDDWVEESPPGGAVVVARSRSDDHGIPARFSLVTYMRRGQDPSALWARQHAALRSMLVGMTVVSVTPTEFGDLPGLRVVVHHEVVDGPMLLEQRLVVSQARVWIASFASSALAYPRHLGSFSRIADSLAVTGLSPDSEHGRRPS